MARGAVVVVLSDGWERGDPSLLGEQMARLQRLAHRVVWANPRKAARGSRRSRRGMAAALPHVDDFVEGHSLDALLRLADVVRGHSRARAQRCVTSPPECAAAGRRAAVRARHRRRRAGQLAATRRRGDGGRRGRRGRGQRVGRLRRGRRLRARPRRCSRPVSRCCETYGISDDDAFSVGLTCGGVLDVLVQRVDRPAMGLLTEVLDALDAHEPVAHRDRDRRAGAARRPARRSGRPEHQRVAGQPRGSTAAVTDDARGLLAAGRDGVPALRAGTASAASTTSRCFDRASFTPPARMLVFGAIDFAAAVARLGVFLGYHVTVCDARPVFANPARFPEAHEVVVRVATRLPQPHQRRRAHRHLRPDPRPEVRRSAARGRAALPGGLHRRHGQPPNPRRPAGPAARDVA